MGDTPNWEALIHLAPHLEAEQVNRFWVSLIGQLRRGRDVLLALFELVPYLDRDEVTSRADALIESMLSKELPKESASQTSQQLLRIYFDNSPVEFWGIPGARENRMDYTMLVNASTSPQAIARLLAHPGCIGELRDLLLRRFEDLVLHDGRHVLL